jgi:hypothetical protein
MGATGLPRMRRSIRRSPMCSPTARPTLWSSTITTEVKQMPHRLGQHIEQHTTKGSPELALLAYAVLALLAYVLLHVA